MPPQQRDDICFDDLAVFPDEAVQRKRRVRFSREATQVMLIPHIDDLEYAEIRTVWYCKSDYDEIKRRLIPLIRKMIQGEYVPESDRATLRGLEFRTKEGTKRRQYNKIESYVAVLEEQERQRENNLPADAERISIAYKKFSASCLKQAQELAAKDEDFAKNYLKDIRSVVLSPLLETSEESEDELEEKSRGVRKLLKHVRTRRRGILEEHPLTSKRVGGQAA